MSDNAGNARERKWWCHLVLGAIAVVLGIVLAGSIALAAAPDKSTIRLPVDVGVTAPKEKSSPGDPRGTFFSGFDAAAFR